MFWIPRFVDFFKGMKFKKNQLSEPQEQNNVKDSNSFKLKSLLVKLQIFRCYLISKLFYLSAFDRHVEWCKEKALIKDSPDIASVSAAKERLKTRIHYKAPNLK